MYPGLTAPPFSRASLAVWMFQSKDISKMKERIEKDRQRERESERDEKKSNHKVCPYLADTKARRNFSSHCVPE